MWRTCGEHVANMWRTCGEHVANMWRGIIVIWNVKARGCHRHFVRNHANDGDPATATANGGGVMMAGCVPVLKPADLVIWSNRFQCVRHCFPCKNCA